MTLGVASLAERYAAVREGVADAIRSADRDPADVTTIVVTKFQPLELVEELVALGATDLGESRHPDARDRASAVTGVVWHFVGQLQTKKARQVAAYADLIHSVDREGLVDALREEPLDVFFQVNLTDDPGRGGAAPADALAIAERIAGTSLRLRGVMAVAPLGEEPRRAFARLRGVSDAVRTVVPAASWISAGMSGDYAEALLEGATHLRIGAAITGPRPSAP